MGHGAWGMGHWSLVIGHWSLVSSHWSLVWDFCTGFEKPGFFDNPSLQAADSLKNPVSLVLMNKSCNLKSKI